MRNTLQIHWLDIDNRTQAYRFYKHYMPYARLTKKERLAVLLSERESIEDNRNQEIIAAIRLRPTGVYNLVTGMLVHPNYRGQGLGHQLMLGINNELTNEGTFLFALPHLVSFYQQHGFVECQNVPNDISQLFNKYDCDDRPLCLMIFRRKNANHL